MDRNILALGVHEGGNGDCGSKDGYKLDRDATLALNIFEDEGNPNVCDDESGKVVNLLLKRGGKNN